MGVKVSFNSNFDEFQKKLDSAKGKVSFDILFNDEFMKKHTKYSNITSFFKVINVSNADDFKALPQSDLENHVKLNTDFNSWNEMSTVAGKEYVIKKLNS